MKNNIVFVKDVSVAYSDVVAVRKVNLTLKTSNLLAVIGRNGGGKSSFVRALVGEIPFAGEIVCDGVTQRDFAYLPQMKHINREFPISVFELVAMGFYRVVGEFGSIRPWMKEACNDALDRVGLAGFGTRQISELSGGQFQRALFARLMVQNSKVIVLDEPFTGMDGQTTRDLLRLMSSWRDQERSVVAVLHDRRHVQENFDEVVHIDGSQVMFGSVENVFEQPATHAIFGGK
tara:strand:+ start:428 stop:1126 length:699 start_codon:yes stop_codon:yes gene_type:complete